MRGILATFCASLALTAVSGGCGVDATESDAVGATNAELLQCEARPISQFTDTSSSCGGTCCDKVDCGPTSAAMMRYIMADGANHPNVDHDHREMRRWYRDFNESTGCYSTGSSGYKGASLKGVAKLVKRVHEKDGGPDYSKSCDGGGTNCSQAVGTSWTHQKFIDKIEDGYVAATIGDCDSKTKFGRGSPCCSSTGVDHFVVVSGYDAGTDTFTVLDPACTGAAKKEWKWPTADFFKFAWGGAGYIKSFVYGRGRDCSGQSTPVCVPTKTCTGKCGTIWDGCKEIACGGCTAPETCGGGGVDNVCGYGEDWDPEASFPVAGWSTGTLQNNGLCTEASGSTNAVFMTACSSTDLKQNWLLTSGRQLKNYQTDDCVEAASSTAGALIKHKPCSSSSLQEWRTTNMEIVNGESGFCLHVPYGDYYDGAPVRYRRCNGEERQQFNYNLATLEIKSSGDTRFCLDAETSSGVLDGNDVKLRVCDGTLSQQWNDGRGGFVNKADTGLCLKVEGGADEAEGADLEVGTCNDKVGQMWALRGQIQLHASPNLCLKAGSPGSQLTVASCNAGAGLQVFTLWSQF